MLQVTDGLGKPIDKGIKEMVVALRAHNFETSGSCKGHISRSCCYPWVHVELPKQKKKRAETLARMKQLFGEFYEDRYRGDASVIITELGRGLTLRLQSRGGLLLDTMPREILTKKVRAKILKRYRKEMDDFRRFLKEKFFNKKT